MTHKSGFIAIIGRPNAGKSTLLNALLGTKVAISSNKPNTTRNNIAGILTEPDTQFLFLDTPGIHKPQQQLGRVLNKNAYNAMDDADAVAWIIDVTQNFGPGDEFVLDRIRNLHKPVILLVNKVDLVPKEKLLRKLLDWQEKFEFSDIVPVSAKDGENLEELKEVFRKYLPEGPSLYPEEMISDHDLAFQLCEIVREKILWRTHEEIPHSVAVVLEKSEERGRKLILSFVIIVDRNSQKGILIGKGGDMIRSIRLAAQTEIKNRLNRPVDLELYVRVEPNWRNKEAKIKEFGIDLQNE
ncbi:GTPase Era [Faecalibaculum rodentium]|jgi:GTP-binding protein Era|uniref:GTPase Era n=2 Tax=Faecalibaculum rodentium TaxID=1702221 RepID=UPI002491ADF4|nr:GTPase Era [Faecalibaculum rodentium]